MLLFNSSTFSFCFSCLHDVIVFSIFNTVDLRRENKTRTVSSHFLLTHQESNYILVVVVVVVNMQLRNTPCVLLYLCSFISFFNFLQLEAFRLYLKSAWNGYLKTFCAIFLIHKNGKIDFAEEKLSKLE